MKNYIKTLSGYIELKENAIIDSHNHVFIEEIKKIDNANNILQNDIKKITKGLNDFMKIGGLVIIDCQPWECGRNANILKQLSDKTGIGIIAVTGFHKKEYYPLDSKIWNMSEAEATEFFESEVLNKLEEEKNNDGRTQAGIIKIAYIGKLEGQYLNLTNAAVKAALKTGAPIMVHTEKGLNIRILVDYLERKEFPSTRVMICHMDKLNDPDLHGYLIEKGFYLEYDTFLKDKYKPEENAWSILENMINMGYCDRITIGSDVSGGFTLEDEYGLACFFSYVIRRLELLNIGKTAVDKILYENIGNFLMGTD